MKHFYVLMVHGSLFRFTPLTPHPAGSQMKRTLPPSNLSTNLHPPRVNYTAGHMKGQYDSTGGKSHEHNARSCVLLNRASLKTPQKTIHSLSRPPSLQIKCHLGRWEPLPVLSLFMMPIPAPLKCLCISGENTVKDLFSIDLHTTAHQCDSVVSPMATFDWAETWSPPFVSLRKKKYSISLMQQNRAYFQGKGSCMTFGHLAVHIQYIAKGRCAADEALLQLRPFPAHLRCFRWGFFTDVRLKGFRPNGNGSTGKNTLPVLGRTTRIGKALGASGSSIRTSTIFQMTSG